MAAFEAAADEWLWRRLGRDGDPAERPAPAQWRAPAPRQSGAAGEAADREADAALLKVRRLKGMYAALPRGGGPGMLPYRAAKTLEAIRAAESEGERQRMDAVAWASREA
eukprot:6023861-Lingulodinium_polyedra.AAC.1